MHATILVANGKILKTIADLWAAWAESPDKVFVLEQTQPIEQEEKENQE